MSDEVTLEWFEYSMASEVGRLRQLSAIRQGLLDQHGFAGLGWSEHIEGACGEMAVAKILGIYWNGSVDTFKAPDLLTDVHVRTRSRHDYDLIVRPNDPDEANYVLVTGKCPEYLIHGFLRGSEAKQNHWLNTYGNRPEAYFIPSYNLKPIREMLRSS